MSRTVAKKTVERRKKARAAAPAKTRSRKAKAVASVAPAVAVRRDFPAENTVERTQAASQELCTHCSKDLSREDRALFVEEEIGRVFCSEDCIAAFFAPEVERL